MLEQCWCKVGTVGCWLVQSWNSGLLVVGCWLLHVIFSMPPPRPETEIAQDFSLWPETQLAPEQDFAPDFARVFEKLIVNC